MAMVREGQVTGEKAGNPQTEKSRYKMKMKSF